jgi:hypothetical protein
MDLFEIPVGEPQESTCACRCGCEVPLSGGTCVDCGEGTHQNNNGLDDFRTCDNANRWPEWSHAEVKARPFRYGWNGYENAYEESVDLCGECFVAWQEVGWN